MRASLDFRSEPSVLGQRFCHAHREGRLGGGRWAHSTRKGVQKTGRMLLRACSRLAVAKRSSKLARSTIMVPRRDGGRIGFEGVEGGGGGWGGGEGASDNARPVFAFATLELSVAASARGNSQTSANKHSNFRTPARPTNLVAAAGPRGAIGTAATLGPAARIAASVKVGGLAAASSVVDVSRGTAQPSSSLLVQMAAGEAGRGLAALAVMRSAAKPSLRPATRRRTAKA